MQKTELLVFKETMKTLTRAMYNSIYHLTQAGVNDKIDDCGVSDCIDNVIMKKREKILAEHEKYHRIWYAEGDKRWKTYVPDFSGEKEEILLAKTKKENLEKSIIEYYEENFTPERTLLTIYPEWIEWKKSETSLANTSKLQNVWTRYYAKSKVVRKSIKDLTTSDIKTFLYDVLNKKKLTKKQYKEFKSVINMMLDYCFENEYVLQNKARGIKTPADNKFRVKEDKPTKEIIYSKDAQKSTIEKAVSAFEKTQNTSYLAICLNFQLGLRVGELSALKFTDIVGNSIKIEREEICERVEGDDGMLHKKGTKVVPHTKTLCGKRILPLTPEAKHYIELICTYNKEKGLINPEGYIFLDNEGNRKTTNSINSALRRINGIRNKKDGYDIVGCPSGNHAIRKTLISNMHSSMKVPDVMIRDFAGHKDFSTTQCYYIYATTPVNDYSDVIAEIFKTE